MWRSWLHARESLDPVEALYRYASEGHFVGNFRASSPIQTSRQSFRTPGPRGLVADAFCRFFAKVREIFLEHRTHCLPRSMHDSLLIDLPLLATSKHKVSIFSRQTGEHVRANRKCAERCIFSFSMIARRSALLTRFSIARLSAAR